MEKEDAKVAIHDVIEEMAAFSQQNSRPEFSEADTKAYFIEPIIKALCWTGIGTVQREYFVKSSQEYIDYVMHASGSRELAVEAKRFHIQLTEKHAAQLVQYCSVEGIERSILTNGREWQVFNTYLKASIQAKQLFHLDLLFVKDDRQYAHVFERLWLLARQNFPSSIRSWMERQRVDTALRAAFGNPSSRVVRGAVEELAAADVSVRPEVVIGWFRDNAALAAGPGPSPTSEPGALVGAPAETQPAPPLTPPGPASPEIPARAPSGTPAGAGSAGVKRYFGVRLDELIGAGILRPGTRLVLSARGRDVVNAEINARGEIVCQGKTYRTPSHSDFARLLGRQATNGWASWYAILPEGRRSLSELRERYVERR